MLSTPTDNEPAQNTYDTGGLSNFYPVGYRGPGGVLDRVDRQSSSRIWFAKEGTPFGSARATCTRMPA
jgi:hypothetical protein